MPPELDHLFVCASPGAPEMERLLTLGMVEGSPNAHPGQGSENRRVFFRNAYLELIWVSNEREARGEQTAPLKLWERWKGRGGDACPFGVCVRSGGGDRSAPFPTWEYRPSYLPEGLSIQVGVNSGLLGEPMLFCLPWALPPERYPSERAQPLEHPAGMREITGVRITTPHAQAPSDALGALGSAGLVRLVPGAAFLMEIVLDHERQGRSADLRPELPLILRW